MTTRDADVPGPGAHEPLAALDRLDRERIEHRSAGAWVDLLRVGSDQRVLLLDATPSRARTRIASLASVVGVVPSELPDDAVALVTAPNIVTAALEHHLASRWDMVILDGLIPSQSVLERLGRSADGCIIVVTANPRSPLGGSRARKAGAPGPRTLSRQLRRAGLRIDRWFGLFRSSTVATTAFDLAAPAATQAVLAAALVHLTGRRAAGVRALRRLPPGLRRLLVPGWMIVAEPVAAASASTGRSAASGDAAAQMMTAAALPIVGRMGYERTPDAKVVLGEPPAALERTYAHQPAAEAEAMALSWLETAGLGLAPRLLDHPAPDRLRIQWVDGADLQVRTMSDRELLRWTEEAAAVLGLLQSTSRQPDGSVLVHGDFWLGNVLVHGDRIRWVIDWGAARWGEADIDRRFLARGLEGFRPLPPALVEQLEAAVDRGLGRKPLGHRAAG